MKKILLVLAVLFSLRMSSATITSTQSGAWSDGATWVGGVAPTASDNVIVATGHLVTITSTTSCVDLTVQSSATLTFSNGNKNLTVSGNLDVDGAVSGSNTNHIVYMTGSGSTIDGTGSIGNKGGLEINTGNKTIQSTANLTISTSFDINGSITVTNNGTITMSGATNITGTVAGSTWTNSTNSSLNTDGAILATGTLNASASGNTVKYYRSGAQTIKTPSSGDYYHLIIEGATGNVKSLSGATIVNGNLTINSATLSVAGSNALTVKGNWTNTGAFTEGTGTVTFDGTSDQTITATSSEQFYSLTTNKSSGTLILASNVIVVNTLTMTAGNINCSTNNVIITVGQSTASAGTLTYTSGTVIGKIERWFNQATDVGVAKLFPVGTASNYNPANITIQTFVTDGSLVAQFTTTGPGAITAPPLVDGGTNIYNTFSDGYWSITDFNGSGISASNYDLTLDGAGFVAFTIGAATRILNRIDDTNPWALDGTHVNATGNVASRTGLDQTINGVFGEYCFGDNTNCTGPAAPTISGNATVCINATGEAYSVTNNPGNTYTWTITGGTQASGGNTNSITVDWGATGRADGNVRVVETNTCTSTEPVDYPVSIETLPVTSISGQASVAENTSGVVYTVTQVGSYTYTWSVTGGTIASGQGTNSITIDWGAATSGQIDVYATGSCGNSPTYNYPVDVYVVINSATTGNWNTASTWDCNCVPQTTNSVRILSTHNVTVNNSTSVNNLQVDGGGTLTLGQPLTVNGDLTVNGIISMSNRNLTLDGVSKSLYGTGTITATTGNFILTNNKSIGGTASITKTTTSNGAFTISAGTTVTNNGEFTVTATTLSNGTITGSNATTSIWTNAANSILNVSGTLLSTGVFNASASGNTVNYTGSAQTTKTPSSNTYYNLAASGSSGTTTMAASASLIITGSVSISSTSTLSANNNSFSVAGNWSNDGTYTAGSGTLTFNGTSTVSGSAATSFGNVTISGTLTGHATSMNVSGTFTNNGTFTHNSGTVAFNGTSASIAGSATTTFNNLTISSGTLTGPSGTMNIAGNWTNNGTAYTHNSGTVVFNGTTTVSGSTATTFNNITISGTLTGHSSTMNVAGNMINNGTFTHNSGTVAFTGTTALTGSSTTSFNNITITGTLTGHATNMNVAGTWTNDGTFTHNSSVVTFNGSANQNISSTSGSTKSTFYNLTISTSGGNSTRVETPVDLINILTVNNSSTLDADGASNNKVFTVVSSSTQTGMIADLSAGSVTGSVTMQRYTTGYSDYRQLACPVQGKTLSDWNDNFTMAGFPNSDQPTGIASTVYTYNEATGAYVAPTDISDPITVNNASVNGKGFYVFVGNKSQYTDMSPDITYDVSGTIISGSQNIPVSGVLTCSNGCDDGYDGYHLVGNPYPAPIVFNNLTLSNINAGYYIWNPEAGNYGYWNGTSGTNGATGTIASSQSFWVQVNNAAGGTITVDETDKTSSSDAGNFLKKGQNKTFALSVPTIRMGLTTGLTSLYDEALIQFKSGATKNYAISEDGAKFATTNPYAPTLSSRTGNDADVVDNVQPSFANPTIQNYEIPVFVKAGTGMSGSYTVTFSGINSIPVDYCVKLYDKFTNTYTNLRTDTSLTFNLSDTTTVARFVLGISNGVELTASVVGNATCYGSNSGTGVAIVNGISPFNYVWSDANGTVQTHLSAGSDTLYNAAAGTYSVTITDASGCNGATMQSITITEPTQLTLSANSVNTTCNGAANGSLTSAVNGGTSSYTYLWSNNETTADISALAAGTYTLTVTDANNCTISNSFSVAEPLALTFNTSTQNATCYGTNTGSIDPSISGGTSGYTYLWSDNSTNATLSGLSAGNYSVVVTDANNCSNSQSFIITEPSVLSVTGNVIDASCAGGANGSISLTVNGGTTGYNYSWSNNETTQNLNGIITGSYSVTVTDANNCSNTQSFNVGGSVAGLSITDNLQHVSCYGSNDGQLTVNATGGTSPYNYSWSNGGSTLNANNLTSGTYSVTITDANNCTVSNSYTITEPTALVFNPSTQDVTCNGANTGSINPSVSGGISGYTYLWSDNSTNTTLTGIIAGNYSVTVTDANNCSSTQSFVISEPTALLVTGNTIDASCAGGANGSIALTVSGGTGTYNYSWSNNETTQNLTNIISGNYTVIVTDANNCSDTQMFNIGGSVSGITLFNNLQNVSCYGDNDGAVTVIANGGTTPYSYSWSNGNTTLVVNNLTAGTYSVTVTDANNCTSDTTYTITQPAATVAQFSSADTLYISNGAVANFTNNSTGADTYAWSFGDGGNSSLQNPTHTYADSGSYSVVLIATNTGCNISDTLTSVVVVINDAVGLNSNSLTGNVIIYTNNNMLYIDFNFNQQTPVTVETYNVIGEKVASDITDVVSKQSIRTQLSNNAASQILLVRISTPNKVYTQKVFNK